MRNESEIQVSYTSFELNKEGKRYKVGEMIRKLFKNQCFVFLTSQSASSLKVIQKSIFVSSRSTPIKS